MCVSHFKPKHFLIYFFNKHALFTHKIPIVLSSSIGSHNYQMLLGYRTVFGSNYSISLTEQIISFKNYYSHHHHLYTHVMIMPLYTYGNQEATYGNLVASYRVSSRD